MIIAKLIAYLEQFDDADHIVTMDSVYGHGEEDWKLLVKFGLEAQNQPVNIIGGVAGLSLLVLQNPDELPIEDDPYVGALERDTESDIKNDLMGLHGVDASVELDNVRE